MPSSAGSSIRAIRFGSLTSFREKVRTALATHVKPEPATAWLHSCWIVCARDFARRKFSSMLGFVPYAAGTTRRSTVGGLACAATFVANAWRDARVYPPPIGSRVVVDAGRGVADAPDALGIPAIRRAVTRMAAAAGRRTARPYRTSPARFPRAIPRLTRTVPRLYRDGFTTMKNTIARVRTIVRMPNVRARRATASYSDADAASFGSAATRSARSFCRRTVGA